jgi:hypothetical protein
MRHSSSPHVANAKISPRRKARSTRREEGGRAAPKLMTGSRDGPNRDEWSRERRDSLPSLKFTASRRGTSSANSAQAAAALARYTSAPLEVAARQRPGDEAERPVLAQLCDPEHFHKAVPVMLSVRSGADGERVLHVHHVRSSAECTQVASLLLSDLTMSRYWGFPSSTQRVIELGVPGCEDKVGSIYLKLGSFECMKRLANMVGREDFE